MRRTTLLPGLLLLAALLVPTLLENASGEAFVVHGHSMEPSIAPGSMAWTQAVPTSEITSGDIVVLAPAWAAADGTERNVIHRVVAVVPTEEAVLAYTYGDGTRRLDPAPTPLTEQTQVVTRVIPFAGYVYEAQAWYYFGFLALAVALAWLVAPRAQVRRPVPVPVRVTV